MADIAKGVRAFTLGTGLSRISGLVRDQVFAYFFGAGFAADAFNAAFRIPNLFRDLFAENALSNAFVPVLTGARARSKEDENRFASNILNTLLLTVGLIVVLGMIFAPALVRAIVVGFGSIPEKTALTTEMTVIMFPFLLFIVLAAWAMSYLNTENEFFIPQVASVSLNAFAVAIPIALFSYYLDRGRDPILGFAVGMTVGALTQFLVQVPRLVRRGFAYRPVLNFRSPEFRKSMSLFIPVAIGLSASRINVWVNMMLISSISGGISWLNYSYRIFFLPLGMLGVSVGQVSLTSFSRLVNEKRLEDLRQALSESLKMVLFLTIPTSALIAVLARPITSVIYERGAFTADDTRMTAVMLILFMIGVPFVSALRNIASVFYACHDARWPMYASFISVGVNIVLNLGLKGLLGPMAFPLSSSIAAVVNIGILCFFLPRKVGSFSFRPIARIGGLLLAASTAGAVLAWAGFAAIIRFLGTSLLVKLGAIAACGLAGLFVFYGACRILRVNEARDFLHRLLQRRTRTAEAPLPPPPGGVGTSV
jgi:putative peptidoglycan lipid II flippase